VPEIGAALPSNSIGAVGLARRSPVFSADHVSPIDTPTAIAIRPSGDLAEVRRDAHAIDPRQRRYFSA
jgi:hypothetical protein